MTFPYEKICFTLISDLPSRTKDILVKRFGLDETEPQTLDAVGQVHGITRERVRQIVEDGVSQIREVVRDEKASAKVQDIFQYFSGILEDEGYLKRQDLFLRAVNPRQTSNHVLFLLHLGDQFQGHRETEYFHPFWANKKEVFEETPLIIEEILNYFEEHKESLSFDEVMKDFAERFGEFGDLKMSSRMLLSSLEVSKHIAQGYNGKWGLRRWPEVYPRGMRDKAYVALKSTEKPLHFVEVAQLIKQLQSQGALNAQKEKQVLPQTVHNELIKDPRFVLVGRGTYALSEWGYTSGTVKDVIMHILKENGNSMAKQEIVDKTLEQRQVKESTILLNLQDKRYFLKDSEGNYYVTFAKTQS